MATEQIDKTGRAYAFRLEFAKEGFNKERPNYVKSFLEGLVPDIVIEETGFGANTTAILDTVNDKKGNPDLAVYYKWALITTIEVTGGKYVNPTQVLVSEQKYNFARFHPQVPIMYAHVYGANQEQCFVHSKKKLFEHENDFQAYGAGARYVAGPVIPVGECKSLEWLAGWITAEVDYLKSKGLK